MRRMVAYWYFNNSKRKISFDNTYTVFIVEIIRCVGYKYGHFQFIKLCILFVVIYEVDIQIQRQT